MLFYISMLETEEEQQKMAYVYEKYKALMLRCAMSIMKNKELAEDAVHEAFLAIIKRKEKYLHNSCPNLGVPIVIITRNKCFNILKKAGNNVGNIDDHEHYLEDGAIPMDNIVIRKEEYDELRRHISRLDESSRNILEMRYVLGMTHKEIADLTELSLENINKKITRAKAKVRNAYAEGSN